MATRPTEQAGLAKRESGDVLVPGPRLSLRVDPMRFGCAFGSVSAFDALHSLRPEF